MPSTFFGLDIAKTGLYTYQSALNTTGHNISNIETKGYTRQVTNQAAYQPISVNSSYGMAGTGVTVTGVEQIRSEYYDLKYRTGNTAYGGYYTKDHYMQQVQSYLNEVNLEGFTKSFDNMYLALEELAKDPSNTTNRTQLTQMGLSLTDYFNSLSHNLTQVQLEANFEVKNVADKINAIAQQVSALTQQINTLEVGGQVANDLRDSRNLLIDELSQYASIKVEENIVSSKVGVTTYEVRMGGQLLVDTFEFNTLLAVPRETKINQNDADGLYDLVWSTGNEINPYSNAIGGTLQSIFQVRDGNNQDNLQGIVTGYEGDTTVTLEMANINKMEKLNIPENGIITIGMKEYNYTSFSVEVDEDTGAYLYTFELKDELRAAADEAVAYIGQPIKYKGIPHYLSQLNEFVRTFSKKFNEIHKQGQDLNGEQGLDFFNVIDKVTGDNYVFGLDEDGEQIEDGHFNSALNSYYKMTAANMTITTTLQKDPTKIATAASVIDGVEQKDILSQLIALKTDKTMFKQGAPSSFLQTLVAEVGVDTAKCEQFTKNQNDILLAIDQQRISISGVDNDEEAMNIVRYKNAYNLSAKILSVMDEIYDKLINQMGV